MLAPEYGGDGKKVGVCAEKKAPVASLPGHWAPNDLLIYSGNAFPAAYQGGAFVAFHGSWNRARSRRAATTSCSSRSPSSHDPTRRIEGRIVGFVIRSSSSYATPATPQENAGVHVLVTASEREVASPNKANADRFAANVLPVIEQIKANGRHVIACDRQSAQRARRCPRLAAASGRQCR